MLPGVVHLTCVSCLPTALECCAPTCPQRWSVVLPLRLAHEFWVVRAGPRRWPSSPRDMVSNGYVSGTGCACYIVLLVPLRVEFLSSLCTWTVDLVHWLCLTHDIACGDDIGPWLSVLATLVVRVVRISLT